MSEKAKLIAEVIEMQKMFADYERKNGVDSADIYAAEEGHPLFNYAKKFDALYAKIDVIAHKDQGSKRWF